MNSQQIFEQMKELWTQFETEHNKTTKISKVKARNVIGNLKRLVIDYRKFSIEENK